MVGVQYKGMVVALVERKISYLLAYKLISKNAEKPKEESLTY